MRQAGNKGLASASTPYQSVPNPESAGETRRTAQNGLKFSRFIPFWPFHGQIGLNSDSVHPRRGSIGPDGPAQARSVGQFLLQAWL